MIDKSQKENDEVKHTGNLGVQFPNKAEVTEDTQEPPIIDVNNLPEPRGVKPVEPETPPGALDR